MIKDGKSSVQLRQLMEREVTLGGLLDGNGMAEDYVGEVARRRRGRNDHPT